MDMEDEINLLDYWRVVRKRWKLIAWTFGVSVVIAAVVSLLMTPIYRATTTIMPIESSGGGLSSTLQNLGSLPFVGGMVGSIGGASGDKLVVILKSRTVAEDVIHSLDLIKVLFGNDQDEPPTLQEAIRSLTDMAGITDNKKGLISVSVEYEDPEIAALIANQYTTALGKFLNENAVSMAKRNRMFIKGQLEKVKEELINAEEAMKSFQTDKRIIAMDAQAEAAIKAVTDLKGQIMAREVQLGVIRQFSTAANPDVLRIKDELRELRKQMTMVESSEGNPGIEALPSLSEAPTLGLQYIRLKRNALVQEKLFELLTQQYEMARIEEAKEDITFQVIDRAVPPEKRIKPKRKLTVMLAGVVSLFAGVFVVFFMEFLENIKEREEEGDEQA